MVFIKNLNSDVSIVASECGFKWQYKVYHLTMNCPSDRSGTLCALMCPIKRQTDVLWRFTHFFFFASRLQKNVQELFNKWFAVTSGSGLHTSVMLEMLAASKNCHFPQQPGLVTKLVWPSFAHITCTNAGSFFHPWLCTSPFAEQGRDERQLCDTKQGHQETENIKPQKSNFQEGRRRGDTLHMWGINKWIN